MTTIKLSGKWRQRPLLFRFLATLYFLAMFSNSSVFAQLNCSATNCTSSDVRVVSAYISGLNNSAIDCGNPNNLSPFDQAELHLIVSSNTQRIGASMVGTLNIPGGNSVNLQYCFSGTVLNNGTNNNLVYNLGTSLHGITCPSTFSLSNVFISWGTGNTNFCTSNAAQCPATPAKCSYAPQQIPVTVKLDVDFTFTPGVCNKGGNSLAVDFSPIITATNLTPLYTYSWNFGDGTPTGSLTVSNLSDITDTIHTYAAAGTYTATLTISDASSTVITKSGINSFTLTSCCNLSAPTVTPGAFCSADKKTVADLPQTDGNGGTYHWYSGSDPNNSYELDPSTLLVNGTTYYVSVASGTCESARTKVTITVNQTPSAPTVGGPICAGASTISGTSGEADGTTITVYDGSTSIGTATVASGAWSANVTPAVAAGDAITATATSSGCSSAASTSVTVSAIVTPPIVTGPICAGSTTISGTSGEADGTTITVYDGTTSIGTATVAKGAWSATVTPAVAAGDAITATATSSACSGTASTSVTVSAIITAPTVGPICAGATTISGTSGEADGTTITVYDGTTSIGTATVAKGAWSATVSPAVAAGDVITATASSSGCSGAASQGSTVNPLPDCKISSSSPTGSATLGSSVTFSGPTGPYSYTWGLPNNTNTSGASFVGSATGSSVMVTTSTVGSYILTLTVTNTQTGCSSSSACTYRMTVTPAGPYYSLTQGFYGNVGGKVCVGGTSYVAGSTSTVPGLIELSISNMPNQQLFLGSVNKNFSMGNTATQANSLITIMPGGGTPAQLGGVYNMTSSKYFPPLSKGKISNVFLSQSITLALNVSIPGNSLAGFALKSGYLTTQKLNTATCPSTTLLSCSVSSSAISSLQITTNSALIKWMNGKTVQDLLNLASSVLGGASIPVTGVSISDINNAIDVINRSFDGGAAFLGYYPTQRSCSSTFSRDMTTAPNATDLGESVNKLSVTAYPNPFTNKVQFSVVSPVSGMASLDVYNIVGQKLKTVYQGYLLAGATQIIEYNVPSPYKGALIYTLKVGNQQINGKVVQVK